MVLQVQNLCKEYPQFSLRDISFQLPEGAIMGLIGENGAGKSTTMRMILGMAQPDSGQISVFGHRGSRHRTGNPSEWCSMKCPLTRHSTPPTWAG